MPSKPGRRPAAPEGRGRWRTWELAAAMLLILFEVYSPALSGPFLLDDGFQLFGRPDADRYPLGAWLNNVRPLLNFTYWLNFQLSGQAATSYHVANVLLHWLNGLLVFVILRRLAGGSNPLAGFGAALFMLHPMQSESVAYISSRSELLSVFFAYSALAVFVTRPPGAVSWRRAAAVIALFGCAVASKEHTAVLPGVLLLMDLLSEKPLQTVRANWRLYVPLGAAAALGLAFVWRTIASTKTVGFRMADMTWYEYAYTQCRMMWRYVRMLVFPAGLNADPDIAISRSMAEPGVALGLAAVIGVTAAAVVLRRRYPLAALGWLIFLVFLAPTSSVVPIRDVFAERRVYLPFVGFLLIVLEGLRRVPARTAGIGGAALLLACSLATYSRAQVWSSHLALWQDTVEKSPRKVRPRFQLAFALYQAQRCEEANREFETAAGLAPPDALLLTDWALALDCVGKVDEAAARLTEAAKLENSAVIHSTLGMIHGKAGRHEEALAALGRALEIDPGFAMAHVYRGNVLFTKGEREAAADAFREALKRDPGNQGALHGLRLATGQ